MANISSIYSSKLSKSNSLSPESKIEIKNALMSDINNYRQDKHPAKTKNAFVTYLAAKSGLSEAPIFKVMGGKTIPTNETIFKLYSSMYDTKEVSILKKKMHSSVKKYLEEQEINGDRVNEAILRHGAKFNPVILENDIRKGIYFLSSGYGCTLDYIKEEFGNRGLEELNALLAIDAVQLKEGKVTRGTVYLQKNTKDNNQFISSLFKNFGPREDAESCIVQKYGFGAISYEATEKIRTELDRSSLEIAKIINDDNKAYEEKPEFQTEKYFYALALSVID